jgi:hypothetical protein
MRQPRHITLRIPRIPSTLPRILRFGRSGILPDEGLRNPTGPRTERLPSPNAPRRRRALIIDHPQSHLTVMAQNIERGTDLAGTLRDQNPVAINPRLVLGSPYRLHPGKQISALFRSEPSAFLLIEKHDRPRRKPLPSSPGNRRGRIGTPKCRCILAFKLSIQAPIKQDHEPKTVSLEDLPLARPRIALFTRRTIQPISGKRETTMKLRQEFVSGIVVSVKARGLCQANVSQAQTKQEEARL